MWKRRILQLLFTVAANSNIQGFITGRVYDGKSKGLCVPGLNCYACPGALFSCPMGALQNVLSDPSRKFSFYVTGLLALFGVTLGRLVCGLLCPFGFLQDLLHMPARLLKKRSRIKIPFVFRRLKYAVLVIMVIALPLMVLDAFGYGSPWFCEYLCPSGIVMGTIPILSANPKLFRITGVVFYIKITVTAVILLSSTVSERFFCKYLCPLGAVYGLFNRVSLYRLNVDETRCVHCGKCENICPMRVNPSQNPNSPECIRCGRCVGACGVQALSCGFEINKNGRVFNGNSNA